jgi:hypothetical protein
MQRTYSLFKAFPPEMILIEYDKLSKKTDRRSTKSGYG